ncbi:DUF7115 domain-containing protein [Halorientalis regularis]|uniref:DUF7115 domain-containing protein n=1 Tax=Halorientalis regularis TaxID=660518 RepID=A0A1G7M3Z6_9EURY|nr:hypothetical protein [Halorientalis regularis]SDF56532.1 hypothetical protein SAMN05216218_107128 [Halorientalis regularis]
MEIPDLVRDALGDEDVELGVNLGDEDVVCLTPTRTLLYRAEGLLSDEKVQEFPHDVEWLDVDEGRRKTKFVLEYVENTRKFGVPSNRDGAVLELLLTGILRADGVTDPDESVAGAFRFSELVLIVTDKRVVRHIGSAVWTEDYEEYPFSDLTDLSFEQGNVATEVVLEIDGRPKRIKTPNEQSRKVQQVVEDAVFDFYDVGSLEELNATIGVEESEKADDGDAGGSDIDIGGGIDPLVSDDEERSASIDGPTASGSSEAATQAESQSRSGDDSDAASESTGRQERSADAGGSRSSATETTTRSRQSGAASQRDLDAVESQLAELTTAVERHNELLERQQRTIKQLIEELREGR